MTPLFSVVGCVLSSSMIYYPSNGPGANLKLFVYSPGPHLACQRCGHRWPDAPHDRLQDGLSGHRARSVVSQCEDRYKVERQRSHVLALRLPVRTLQGEWHGVIRGYSYMVIQGESYRVIRGESHRVIRIIVLINPKPRDDALRDNERRTEMLFLNFFFVTELT